MRRRTNEERAAYLEGFEAGVDAALQEVARLNFGDVAKRARAGVKVTLDLVTSVSAESGRKEAGE